LGPKITATTGGGSGVRMEPWRARTRSFCLKACGPPPRTSARVSVLAVPCRALASAAPRRDGPVRRRNDFWRLSGSRKLHQLPLPCQSRNDAIEFMVAILSSRPSHRTRSAGRMLSRAPGLPGTETLSTTSKLRLGVHLSGSSDPSWLICLPPLAAGHPLCRD